MKLSLRTVCQWLGHALLMACLYTVIVTFLLLLLTTTEGWLDEPAIPLGRFFEIFAISLLVAFSMILFKIQSLPKFIALILNYTTILIGFFVIFVASDRLSLSSNTGKIFIYLILLTVCYALIATAVFFLKRAIGYMTGTNNEKTVKNTDNTKKGTDDYESIL